ncbi:MAG TPA: hypothetical protein VNC78_01540 [Actinomycetota bacterium]|nr:hypothetical protein [Actinomycetota bacterium]
MDRPVDRYTSLEETYRRLEVLRDSHARALENVIALGDLSAFDLFLPGLVEKSLHLTKGFLAMFDDWNLIVAAPIVRMQIECLVRLAYVSKHPEAIPEALEKPFDRILGPDGRHLTDPQLVTLAREDHPWVGPVYGRVSTERMNLPPQQPLTSDTVTGNDGGAMADIQARLDERFPESFLAEVLAAMEQATSEILAYISRREVSKKHPGWTIRPPRR